MSCTLHVCNIRGVFVCVIRYIYKHIKIKIYNKKPPHTTITRFLVEDLVEDAPTASAFSPVVSAQISNSRLLANFDRPANAYRTAAHG